MTKEILEITKKFHDTYEKLSKEYDYETREDTKVFNVNSNNGKLMYATVNEVISPILNENQELKSKLKDIYKDYSDMQEENERVLEKIRELKEQNKKEFADYIKFKKEQYDEYLEKVNKLIKEKQELKKKHEITKKIARDWAAECTLLFNHNKEMKVYKEVLQKYKEIIGDDKK